MKKVKIMLSYSCYPAWLYDDNDNIIDNILPDEISDDSEIKQLLDDIQKTFDSLFVNDSIVFDYLGFSTEAEKQSFLQKIDRVMILIKDKVGHIYTLEKSPSISSL